MVTLYMYLNRSEFRNGILSRVGRSSAESPMIIFAPPLPPPSIRSSICSFRDVESIVVPLPRFLPRPIRHGRDHRLGRKRRGKEGEGREEVASCLCGLFLKLKT